jgi:hypothetical protein
MQHRFLGESTGLNLFHADLERMRFHWPFPFLKMFKLAT